MKSTYVKAGLYALALLTPFAAQASNSEHEDRQPRRHDNQYLERDYLSQIEALPVVSVPEPGSLVLVGAGLIGLFVVRRQQNQNILE